MKESTSSHSKLSSGSHWNLRREKVLVTPSFWIAVVVLVTLAFFHYFRGSLLPYSVNEFFSRHAVERILFLIPIVISTHSFGRKGGLLTLGIVVLVMLPRVVWVSPYPTDASVETVAVIVVGYYIIHIINAQVEERVLRQEADAKQIQLQQRLNEVAEQITSELELDRILTKVLQIAEELSGADGGGIALIDPESESINYQYLHNLPQELRKIPFSKGEGVAGEVINSGCSVIVGDYPSYPTAIPAFTEAGFTGVVAVPIVKGEHIYGALTLVTTSQASQFTDRDVDILGGIGRQAGIAIENSHLYERMRFYAQQITRAQENERKRIARELHDDTVQMLIALSRRIENLVVLSETLSQTIQDRLTSLQELISTTLRGLRRFIQDLRPPTLDHLGLIAAIEGLTDGLGEDNIEAELNISDTVQRMTPDEELLLFRIVQEALSNIRRHSGATHAWVNIRFSPDMLQAIVEDNGCGFKPPERMDDLVSASKLGLIGMYERARMLGGTLGIQSMPGEGTKITLDVPI